MISTLMKMRQTDDRKDTASSSRFRFAVVAAACMLGSMPCVAVAEDPFPPLPSRDQLTEEWVYGSEEELFLLQQAEEEALLGEYADRGSSIPEAVLQQVQEMVRKYGRSRARFCMEQVGPDGVLALPLRQPARVLSGSGLAYQRRADEFYLHHRQLRESYLLLGKHAYTDEDMPKEKLAAAGGMMLSHVRERRELRKKWGKVEGVSSGERGVTDVGVDHGEARRQNFSRNKSLTGVDYFPDEWPPKVADVPLCTKEQVKAMLPNLWANDAVMPGSYWEFTAKLRDTYRMASFMMYDRQRQEEDELLGAELLQGKPVPEEKMRALDWIVQRYLARRDRLWHRYQALLKMADSLVELHESERSDLLYSQSVAREEAYSRLMDGSGVDPDEALEDVRQLILEQVVQRQKMQRKHAQEQREFLRELSFEYGDID